MNYLEPKPNEEILGSVLNMLSEDYQKAVPDLLAANTPKKKEAFLGRYPGLLNLTERIPYFDIATMDIPERIADISQVRGTLQAALTCHFNVNSEGGEPPFQDLGQGVFMHFIEHPKGIEFTEADFLWCIMKKLDSLKAFAPAYKLVGFANYEDVEREDYLTYLEALFERYKATHPKTGLTSNVSFEAVEAIEDESGYLIPTKTNFLLMFNLGRIEDKEFEEVWRRAANALFTLHLQDVTVCVDGNIEERREFNTGIAALWWNALNSLQRGSVSKCPCCGSPFILPAQGRPKTFCSDACRQKAGRERREMHNSPKPRQIRAREE